MKKIILLAAIAAITTSATAQIKFGAQVGGNLANVKSEYSFSGTTVKEKSKVKFGFLIGLVAEVPLASSVSFRPELNFIQKGTKVNDTQSSSGYTDVTTGEITLNFIELPLNIVYRVAAGSGNVFFGAGPSIGYGLSGKYKSTSTTTYPGMPSVTDSENGKVKFDGKKYDDLPASDNDNHLKSLDFGGNILAGYQMSNGVYINVGYTVGFSNLSPNADESVKTNGLTIKLGYMFGGKAEAKN
ncbi:MAG: porin family protein [Ferruginibacter sp.]